MNLAEACQSARVNRRIMESYQRGIPLSRSGEPPDGGVNNFSEISFTTEGGISVVRTRLEIHVGWDPTRFNRKLTMITSTESGHLHSIYETYGNQAGTDLENSGNWTDDFTLLHYPSREFRARNDIPDNEQPILLARRRRSFVAPDGGVEYANGRPGRRIEYVAPINPSRL